MPRSKRQGKRLDAMPDAGRVTIAHPSREQAAKAFATEYMTDYVLTPIAPAGSVYLMNVDQINAPITYDELFPSR